MSTSVHHWMLTVCSFFVDFHWQREGARTSFRVVDPENNLVRELNWLVAYCNVVSAVTKPPNPIATTHECARIIYGGLVVLVLCTKDVFAVQTRESYGLHKV
jgi:hypothetical protein